MSDFGKGGFGLRWGEFGYIVTTLTMEAVGNGRREQVEVFGGGGKGEINGRAAGLSLVIYSAYFSISIAPFPFYPLSGRATPILVTL